MKRLASGLSDEDEHDDAKRRQQNESLLDAALEAFLVLVECGRTITSDMMLGLVPHLQHVMCSGGAAGADALWTVEAAARNLPVFTLSFHGHQLDRAVTALASTTSKIVLLTDSDLEQGWQTVDDVCRLLRRPPLQTHPNAYVRRLLLRDYWQVAHADTVYAIGECDPSVPSLHIAGGTAYACEAFAARFPAPGPIPLYLFDQRPEGQTWLQAVRSRSLSLQWRPCGPGRWPLPPPSGRFAGIGTRALNWAGRQALLQLMQSTSAH